VPDPHRAARRLRAAAGLMGGAYLVAVTMAGCILGPTATPSASLSAMPSASLSPSQASPSADEPSQSVEPTSTPEPPLSLPLPRWQDARHVSVEVAPEVERNGDGEIVVTVTNLTDRRVRELVLRWSTDLDQTLFLAPFRPSQQRIAEGGPPLQQHWTKWVRGPGEQGEPAGTTSLGWGPLLPGATLTIPIQVTRMAAGEVSFDLQLLAGEAILALDDSSPAEHRVTVP
jgi:hypothetical protein